MFCLSVLFYSYSITSLSKKYCNKLVMSVFIGSMNPKKFTLHLCINYPCIRMKPKNK